MQEYYHLHWFLPSHTLSLQNDLTFQIQKFSFVCVKLSQQRCIQFSVPNCCPNFGKQCWLLHMFFFISIIFIFLMYKFQISYTLSTNWLNQQTCLSNTKRNVLVVILFLVISHSNLQKSFILKKSNKTINLNWKEFKYRIL